MNKVFVIIEITQFEDEDLPRIQVEQRVRPAPPRERGHGVPLEEMDGRFRGKKGKIISCNSMAEADEYVNETLLHHPQYKFLICESIAFVETVPTPPIKKVWDENGQLK